MNIKKINEISNPLLNRKLVTFDVDFEDKTPSRQEISRSLASTLNVKDELLDIRVKPKYGQKKISVMAYIYDDVNSFKMFKKKVKTKEVKEVKTENAQEAKAQK